MAHSKEPDTIILGKAQDILTYLGCTLQHKKQLQKDTSGLREVGEHVRGYSVQWNYFISSFISVYIEYIRLYRYILL